MNKIKWVIDRWKIMQHPYEEWYRIKQQIQYHITDKKWYKNPPVKNAFHFHPLWENKYSIDTLCKIVSFNEDDMKAFNLLNVKIPDILSHSLWNYDAKNKKIASKEFVHLIDDFDYSKGEVKYVYELSRLYHFPCCAAYAVAHDRKDILNIIKNQLIEWCRQNPFLGTIAWKSGNVVGIRAINLIFYRIILDLSNEEDRETDKILTPLIELHFKYLISHLSLYSSKGNHYIGEISGIIAICAAYRFKHSERYLKIYFNELQNEILRLVHPDGGNKEQATRYQASYINLFLTAILFAQSKGYEISPEVNERLKSMYMFLDALRISKYHYFHVGDNDDAQLLYPYADKAYNIYESMLNDATVLYGIQPKAGYHFDLRNYLLFGDKGLAQYESMEKDMDKKLPAKISLYKESGYFLIKNEQIQLLFDTGEIGLLPSMCHGHSDILSFILYYQGNPVLIDPGTYQYNQYYKKYRDYFHGVHAHNTVSINNSDQAVSGAGMFWMSHPKVEIQAYSLDAENPYCMASHNGYRRKNMQVTHSRKIALQRNRRRVLIIDKFEGKGKSTAYFYLHFHPSVSVCLENETLFIFNANFSLTLYNPLFGSGKLYKGDKHLPLGWYAKSYDNLELTFAFRMEVNIENGTEWCTEIKY